MLTPSGSSRRPCRTNTTFPTHVLYVTQTSPRLGRRTHCDTGLNGLPGEQSSEVPLIDCELRVSHAPGRQEHIPETEATLENKSRDMSGPDAKRGNAPVGARP